MTVKKPVMIVCALLGVLFGLFLFAYLVFLAPILSVLDAWTDNAVDLTYTEQVLISNEAPTSLVWYGRLQGPTAGSGLAGIPSYTKYAAIGADAITTVDGEWQAAVSQLKESVQTTPLDPDLPDSEQEREAEFRMLREGVGNALCADERTRDAIPDRLFLDPSSAVRMEDRIYALCVEDHREYEPIGTSEEEAYRGARLLYVVCEAETYQLLYVKYYFMPDYWGGIEHTPVLVDAESNPMQIVAWNGRLR